MAVFGSQLGLGKQETATVPSRIPGLDHVVTTQASCGGEHTVLLTSEGRVYGCGAGGEGQLGPKPDWPAPSSLRADCATAVVRLKCLNEFKVVQVAAGQLHTVALTEAGEPLAFGSNEFGQLGRRKDSNVALCVPVRVSGLAGTRIVQVCVHPVGVMVVCHWLISIVCSGFCWHRAHCAAHGRWPSVDVWPRRARRAGAWQLAQRGPSAHDYLLRQSQRSHRHDFLGC
jgi:alpha-tubulin suppressor-like RCC1 family protein